MKKVLYLLPFFVSLSLCGQSYLSIDVFGGVGLSKSANSILDRFTEQETIITGRYGVGVSVPLGSKLLVRTGAQLVEYGFAIENIITDVNGQRVDEDPIRFENRNRAGEVPILIRYEWATYGLFQPFIEGGMLANFYINSRARLKPFPQFFTGDRAAIERPFQEQGLRRFNSVARLSLGTNIHLHPKLAVSLGVVGQRFLATIAEEGTADIYPWRLDVELGVRYFLKK